MIVYRKKNMIKRMIENISIYLEIMYKSILEQRQYKIDLYLRCVYEIVIAMVNLIFYDVIYYQSQGIEGWSLLQMKNLVLISSLLDGVVTFLFSEGLGQIPKLISTGELDYLLSKPLNIRLYVSLNKVSESQIYSCLIFFIYLLVLNNRAYINFFVIIKFILSFCMSVFILYCLFLLIMSVAFWTVRVDIGVSLFFQLFNFGNKPLAIYPPILKFAFMFLVPIGIAINFPTLNLKDQIGTKFLLLETFVSIYMFAISNYVFKKGLKQYTSTGN